MLISPLMGPIIGMGLAVGINDLDLLRRAVKNFGVATLISVLTATVYFLITPLGEAQSELLARTSPTLYDVLIAFCGGAAGIIALCTRGKGNVIPGVAIATALMPPLCTAGFGLATGHLMYFLGAFYLFFINTVFIALATYCGVRLMRFHRREFQSPEKARMAHRYLMIIIVLTMLPAAYMTVRIVQQHVFDSNVRHFIKAELSQHYRSEALGGRTPHGRVRLGGLPAAYHSGNAERQLADSQRTAEPSQHQLRTGTPTASRSLCRKCTAQRATFPIYKDRPDSRRPPSRNGYALPSGQSFQPLARERVQP